MGTKRARGPDGKAQAWLMVSSGVKNLGKLFGGWVLAFGVVAVTVTHFDEVRTALGLKLNPEDFGISLEQPADSDGRRSIETVEAPPEPRRREERRAPRPSARQDDTLFKLSVQLPRGRDGHFHADASINGRTIGVLVDTGATLVSMSYEDAQAVGISVQNSDFRYVSSTANGQARFARVTLDQVQIGNVSVRNVEASVSQPGKLSTTLLGMSFLGQLRMEMKAGLLVLEQ